MNTVTSPMASAGEVVATLTVTAGLHHGATMDLGAPTCRIGSDEAADILLGDPGVAPEHLVLRFHGRQLAVEAIGGDTVVNGRVVHQGTGQRGELPAELHFEGVSLMLSRPAAPSMIPALPKLRALPPRWRTSLNRGATLTALVATLGVLAVYEFIDVNQAGANIGSYPTASLDPQALDGAHRLTTESRPNPAKALRRQLSDAGLDSLSVVEHGGYLSVSGQYAAAQSEAWDQTQRWFDQRYGGHQVLLNDVKARQDVAPPDLKLQAVWLGDSPYVIDGRGKRLYPGAALDSGWVISAIQPDRITLSRGDDQFALTL